MKGIVRHGPMSGRHRGIRIRTDDRMKLRMIGAGRGSELDKVPSVLCHRIRDDKEQSVAIGGH
jgi:hypothetical protein